MMEKIGSCKKTMRSEDEQLRLAEQREKDFSDLKIELLEMGEAMVDLRKNFRDRVSMAVENRILIQEAS